jgi:LuxR family maltose regulon positive regulatory protein
VIESAHQALDCIPEDDLVYNLRARSNLFLTLGYAHWRLGEKSAADQALSEARRIGEAIEHLSVVIDASRIQTQSAYDRGRLLQAAAICQEVLRSIVEPSEQAGRPLPIAGGLYVLLGSVLLEWNDLEGADQALTKGLELAKLMQRDSVRNDGYIALARLRQAQGNVARAFDLLEQVVGVEAVALKIRFWLVQAEHDPRCLTVAARFAEERQIRLEHGERCQVEQLALARLLIAQFRARPAPHEQPDLQPLLRFLDGQFQAAEAQGQDRWMLEALILRTLASHVQGDADRALFALERALILAEPEGYVRFFVDEGAPMARLLYQAAVCGIKPDYTGKLLAAFPDSGSPPADEPKARRLGAGMVEPLTRRELEVLQLVAAGLSNREIAQRLVISLGTAKVHISNIYGKLGVRKRTQAVARARTLGILPPTQ